MAATAAPLRESPRAVTQPEPRRGTATAVPALGSRAGILALQRSAGNRRTASALKGRALQRKIGDGSDLASPRFNLIEDLEAAFDKERVIKKGDKGRGVQAIQQALYDLGFPLPKYGADGEYGTETVEAVKAFQRANPPLKDDGKVGRETMTVLDARFAAFTLPSASDRADPWTPGCVLSILCPWSPHTIDLLHTKITLKSFDDIWWDDEEWDGSAWVPKPFPGGGYNTGTEIGVFNSSCEEMAKTLYHEVLHADQPTSHRTTLQRESYAYRIEEEFNIAAGLSGRPEVRSTDARGREFADRTKVEAFVRADAEYPGVPASGADEEIIGKAATLGHVEVERADRTVYTRPAAVGESVPGPRHTTNEVTHSSAAWVCP